MKKEIKNGTTVIMLSLDMYVTFQSLLSSRQSFFDRDNNVLPLILILFFKNFHHNSLHLSVNLSNELFLCARCSDSCLCTMHGPVSLLQHIHFARNQNENKTKDCNESRASNLVTENMNS